MPDTRRINMRKLRDVLRLKLETKLSHERTAAALNLSKGVVAKYVTLANAAGLDCTRNCVAKA
jgi:DNA-binding transcriptional regulator LsrR (DeoR family)